MPLRTDIQRILLIGSGPIVIGQGAEFDYAGTQASLALKEEGYDVILVNSNPATIMTDEQIADRIYMEPLTVDFLETIIRKERPDGILPSIGGQTGLNLVMELEASGILEKYGVTILGTSLQAIKKGEDRDLFKKLMKEINEPIPESTIVNNVEEALAFSRKIGYPLIVRPAYTLGGTGGGIVSSQEELFEIVKNGLLMSPVKQCLIERSIAGYKEIEYEVIRDQDDQAIVVCNMENLDPVGVHTGDSIVFAPVQTLSKREEELLRKVSLKIVRKLGIEGACNVQLALEPDTLNYYVIEVNPRVSRSSALASKATAYPIARVSAKIAVGLTLDEIENPFSNYSNAFFEPVLDYIITKIPRWPFDKFASANRHLGTQMKATGEVMAIGRNIEESLLKAVRSLETKMDYLKLAQLDDLSIDDLLEKVVAATDQRLFVLAECIRRGISLLELNKLTRIDLVFLSKLSNIIQLEKRLQEKKLDIHLLKEAKENGFTDNTIARFWKIEEEKVYQMRKEDAILAVYQKVDTCIDDTKSDSSYYYSTYDSKNESPVKDKESIIVLGSGPIRIGQGVEFDYATVHCVQAIKEAGYEAIVINNNPETVSTDFSISDKLYFEPLYIEDVMNVIEHEKPLGVIVQFGGQTGINLAEEIVKRNKEVKILGTDLADIDRAEDRDKFERLLRELEIPQPEGAAVKSIEEGKKVAERIAYPLMVRPSYVLGGRAMEIVSRPADLVHYLENALKEMPGHPILIDRYLLGKEVEVDAVSDGEDVYIPGIIEHVERAGVHSGDSMAIYPVQTLSGEINKKIENYTVKIARGLKIRGIVNIQFIISDQEEEVYVLEVNPRSSRTVPFISKATGIPMSRIATKATLGYSLQEMGYQTGIHPVGERVYVKAPVFSFSKLRGVDIPLGPEMKSTGEVIGIDKTVDKAFYKALLAAGINIPLSGTVIMTIADREKKEAVWIAKKFIELGFNIIATKGTAEYFKERGIPVRRVNHLAEGKGTIIDVIREGEAHFVINTLSGSQSRRDGFLIRRTAVENKVPCFTSFDTVKTLLSVLDSIIFMTKPL